VRIDMGVDIEIDVSHLRPGPDGTVEHCCAVGRIEYGDGGTGTLVYIKACMTGNENLYIREYRDRNPTFPHQTTADQFFDEAQLEAYRALGFHICRRAIGGDFDAFMRGNYFDRLYKARPIARSLEVAAALGIPVTNTKETD